MAKKDKITIEGANLQGFTFESDWSGVNNTDETVTIDLNHPYAGEDLHFKGTILELREASPAELEAIRHPKHGCCGGGCHKGKGKKGECGDCGGCS